MTFLFSDVFLKNNLHIGFKLVLTQSVWPENVKFNVEELCLKYCNLKSAHMKYSLIFFPLLNHLQCGAFLSMSTEKDVFYEHQ